MRVGLIIFPLQQGAAKLQKLFEDHFFVSEEKMERDIDGIELIFDLHECHDCTHKPGF